MKERVILHSDANCFYASVEMVLNPKLRGLPIAVCGSQETRHGIVLTKSEEAKKFGVKTGMAIWQAKKCCPNLLVVPPQYDYYLKFSKLLHSIYKRYTDLVEPFGMDECWLDVTATPGEPMQIAEQIRQAVKDELGITVSIGVSFNKIFAKLGSDYKKPDAITEITKDNFKDIVWPLPCSDLLYCGRATTAKLARYNIKTIGEIAQSEPEFLQARLGKNGLQLWRFASGVDESRVAHEEYAAPMKSVGHGITCVENLNDENEVKMVIFALSQDIGYKLRAMNLRAGCVHLCVRDSELFIRSWQEKMRIATNDEGSIAKSAYKILTERYFWNKPIRAVTVTVSLLEKDAKPLQYDMFLDSDKLDKRRRIMRSIDIVRDSYGKYSIGPALILAEKKMPRDDRHKVVMPGYMYS